MEDEIYDNGEDFIDYPDFKNYIGNTKQIQEEVLKMKPYDTQRELNLHINDLKDMEIEKKELIINTTSYNRNTENDKDFIVYSVLHTKDNSDLYKENSFPNLKIRTFSTGATRDTDKNKIDLEGFLDPLVLQRFGEYMLKHQVQSDGSLRASDNWKKGIPKDAYIKSNWRHFLDLWMEHRGYKSREGVEEALCAIMFNTMGYLYEVLKEKPNGNK